MQNLGENVSAAAKIQHQKERKKEADRQRMKVKKPRGGKTVKQRKKDGSAVRGGQQKLRGEVGKFQQRAREKACSLASRHEGMASPAWLEHVWGSEW